MKYLVEFNKFSGLDSLSNRIEHLEDRIKRFKESENSLDDSESIENFKAELKVLKDRYEQKINATQKRDKAQKEKGYI